jgi:hypothetical protein
MLLQNVGVGVCLPDSRVPERPSVSLWAHSWVSLVAAASSHRDMMSRKTCIATLTRFVTEWAGSGGSEPIPGFTRFAIEQFAPEVRELEGDLVLLFGRVM